jgi:hypothetical protein
MTVRLIPEDVIELAFRSYLKSMPTVVKEDSKWHNREWESFQSSLNARTITQSVRYENNVATNATTRKLLADTRDALRAGVYTIDNAANANGLIRQITIALAALPES